MDKTKLLQTWNAMHKRLQNPTNPTLAYATSHKSISSASQSTNSFLP